MRSQNSGDRGLGDIDAMIAVQVKRDPFGADLIGAPQLQDFFNHFRRCFAGMTMGDGLLAIQARSSFALAGLFPPIKRRTRDIEFLTCLGSADVLCIFQYGQLEPDAQFFSGFWVYRTLLSSP